MAIPVKLTRAHQITLPKRLLAQAGWLGQEYFLADIRSGVLILKPLTVTSERTIDSFEGLQKHFARLRIIPQDIQKAVRWARQQEKTQTKVTALRLKELIHRHKLEQLRALRGRVMLNLNITKSRKRQFSPKRG